MTVQLDEHLGYLKDPVRLAAFSAAIAQSLRPGSRVLDLGCGTGVLGLLCLKAGAGFVEAVDATGMIEVARRSLTEAGWAGQVRFTQGRSQEVRLEDPVDLVICDQVGCFGFDYGILETLRDASVRFLKPGGILLPARLELQAACVGALGPRQPILDWANEPVPEEFRWLTSHALHRKHLVKVKAQDLLGPSLTLGSLVLGDEHPAYLSWSGELVASEAGTVQGIAGWFRCELAEGVWMTNSPLAADAIDRAQAFLPLAEPIRVEEGDVLQLRIQARPADNLLAWEVEMRGSGQVQSQSTWLGELLTPAQIAARQPEHVPVLTAQGRARRAVLASCDGTRSLRDIEELILREHPSLLPSDAETRAFIARVLGRDAS